MDRFCPECFMLSLDETYEVIRRWSIPVSEQDKITMANIIQGTDNTIGVPLVKFYFQLIKPFLPKINRYVEYISSGLFFFYICVIYCMHFPNWGDYIQDILLYDLLYLLVDHYIDDNKISHRDKDIAISQMFLLIKDPWIYKNLCLKDPILEVIVEIYIELLTRRPNIIDSVVLLFQEEIKGFYIQKDLKLTREDYYQVAVNKGGYTVQILQNIIGNEDFEVSCDCFNIGAILQLVDDCLDVISDKEDGIYTIASYDLLKDGNLNRLWIEIVSRIHVISNRFTVFKILYTLLAVYLPDRLKDLYTKEIRDYTSNFNLFGYEHGCSMNIVKEIISNELFLMDSN